MANDITPSDLSDSDGQEKSTVAQVEYKQDQDQHVSFDDKATKRLLRKMDIRLIPFLALLYLLSFLDRYVHSRRLSESQPFYRHHWVAQKLTVIKHQHWQRSFSWP